MDQNRGNLQGACKTEKFLQRSWTTKDLPPNVIKTIDYKITPLYEMPLSDYISKKHYSLMNNKTLAKEWEQYKETPRATRTSKYFEKIDHRDYHFYNYYVRFKPSASERMEKPRGFILTGKVPQVDKLGVVPVPIEQNTMRSDIYRMGVDVKKLDRENKALKGKTNSKGNVKGKK